MSVQRVWFLVVLASVFAWVSQSAHAQTLTVKDIMSQFNAVVSDSFSSGHDVEGRLVAGTITGGATFYNHPSGIPSAFQAINAGTIADCSNCNVNGGGSVNYLASNNGHFNLNADQNGHTGTVQQKSPDFSLAAFTAPLNALQHSLSQLTANNTVKATDPNQFTFNLTSSQGDVAVFNLDVSLLSQARTILFSSNFASYNTIVVNVIGNAGYEYTQSANFNAFVSNGFDLASHLVWNFVGAAKLSFTQWQGAILAGDATVTNSSPLNGFLYAKNLNANGELHDRSFSGNLTVPGPVIGGGLLPVLLLGLGGLIYRRRIAGTV